MPVGLGGREREDHVPEVEGAAGAEHRGGIEEGLLLPEVGELVQGGLGGDDVGGLGAVLVVEESGVVPVSSGAGPVRPRLREGEHVRGHVHPVRLESTQRGPDHQRAGAAGQVDQAHARGRAEAVEQRVVAGGVGALVPVVGGDGVGAGEVDAHGFVFAKAPSGVHGPFVGSALIHRQQQHPQHGVAGGERCRTTTSTGCSSTWPAR